MSDSIIVYRNPAEQAFWEGGYLIPIIGGIGVGLVVFLALNFLAEKLNLSHRVESAFIRLNGILALVAFFYTMNKMLI